MRLAGIATVVLAMVVGMVAFYRSDVFAVTTVDVIGAQRLSQDTVLDIAQMPSDATLIRFPSDEVAARLEADPWIADAVVTRDFPDTARIRITERVPAALVDVGDEYFWLVDAEGFIIVQGAPETTSTVPIVIRDIPGLDPQPGTRTTSEPLLNALAVWAGLPDDLGSRVRAITAESVDKTTLITGDEVWILVGSAEDIEKKAAIALGILDEQAGEIVYVNVRTVDTPTFREVGDE